MKFKSKCNVDKRQSVHAVTSVLQYFLFVTTNRLKGKKDRRL